MTQAVFTHINNLIDNKFTETIEAFRISFGNRLEALMDRKDQAVRDRVDTSIIKLDAGITDAQNRTCTCSITSTVFS